MAQTSKEIKVAVVTQRELELGQENQALRAYLKQADSRADDLVSALMLWMVGWRDDLAPAAQLEGIIREFDR